MSRNALVRALSLLALLLAGAPLWAQRTLQDPHIHYVYPAGGKVDSTFDVVVGGQFLRGTDQAYISGGHVKVTVKNYLKHLTQGEYAGLNRRLAETRRLMIAASQRGVTVEEYKKIERREAREALKTEGKSDGKTEPKSQPKPKSKPRLGRKAFRDGSLTLEMVAKQAGITAEQLAQMEEFRRRQADPRRQLNPQLMEEVTLQVRIAPGARLGERELRLICPSGMSNPLYFHVGQMPEFRETEPNDGQPDTVVGTRLPAVINGQIMPGDVDRFAFSAKKGMRIVAIGHARQLIPYLADAVPGWFQAVLTLYDAEGDERAYANAFAFHQDPILSCEIPQDGQYVLEIRDAIYRGREDFVYRILLGELPFVTGIFPLGGRAGTMVNVELTGWNLPVDHLKIDAYYDRARAIRSLSLRTQDKLASNRAPFAVDMIADALEQEPNNKNDQAQPVTLPSIVNGRIDRPGDVDVFRFEGRAKETVIAEVFARRLNSPVDSLLTLTDSAGKELASNDDYEDKGLALSTHHADSRLLAALPATGTYFLRLVDAQHKGGKEYAYRLHIRPPRPDFELRVVPSSVIARSGTTVVIAAYALRRDGFGDDITLELEKAPPGFKLSGAWIPAGQDKVRLTMTVPPAPTEEPLHLQLEGHATVKGRKISHLAIPAEALTQAFAYQHLVPAKDWTVAVTGKGGGRPQVSWVKEERLRLISGGISLVRAATPIKNSDLAMELSEPPEGITIESTTNDSYGVTVRIQTDAKVKPGMKGNLIVNAFLERSLTTAGGKVRPNKQRSPLGILPALPFEVVAAEK